MQTSALDTSSLDWSSLFEDLLTRHVPRVLVVDDDPDLLPIFERIVERMEPRVELDWAFSVEEARQRLDGDYYDAIVADYALEGEASGLSLRSLCDRLQPQASFAMMSAYPLADLLPSVGVGTRFLRKPFSMLTCSDFLRSLLPTKEGEEMG